MIGESQDTLKEEREFERTIFKEYDFSRPIFIR